MFTGIISDIGDITNQQKTVDGLKITVRKPATWKDLKPGNSIAVNGVCLTASAVRPGEFKCLIMPETLRKTTLGQGLPKKVNIERPLRADGEIGGHFVQGHIDGVGSVSQISRKNGYRVSIEFPSKFKRLVVPKGSITIDGVSLTITTVKNNQLSVALVPFTLQNTTLGKLKVGDKVNLEFDMIAKQVAQILKGRMARGEK